MNEIQCLEKQLELMKMCEGTKVKWWECVQYCSSIDNRWYKKYLGEPAKYGNPHGGNRFALAIVEDKAVFEGDELFSPCTADFLMNGGTRKLIASTASSYSITMKDGGIFPLKDLTWNPPKPRTVMVELTVEDARSLANPTWVSEGVLRIANACHKALGSIK